MVGKLGAQIALVAFAAAIVAGLYAGNAPTTVLTRALTVLAVALFVGQAAAYVGKLALRDFLQHEKTRIDRAHVELTDKTTATQTDSTISGEPRAG